MNAIKASLLIHIHCTDPDRYILSAFRYDGLSLLVVVGALCNIPFEYGSRQFDFSISPKHTRSEVENGRISRHDRSNAALPQLVAKVYIT